MSTLVQHWNSSLLITSAIGVLVAFVAATARKQDKRSTAILTYIGLIFILGAAALRIEELSVTLGSDLYVYRGRYENLQHFGLGTDISASTKDVGFSVLLSSAAALGLTFGQFLVAVYGIITLSLYAAARALVSPPYALLMIALLPLYFPFHAATTNVLRQGLAAALVCLACSLWFSKRSSRSGVLVIISAVFMHWSALVPAATLLLVRQVRWSRRFAGTIWIFSATAFVTGVNSKLLGPLVDGSELARGYTSDTAYAQAGSAGQRVDFFVFTMSLVILLLVAERLRGVRSQWTPAFVSIASTYNLFGFVAFSDRVAMYTWILWPVAIIGVSLQARVRPHADPDWRAERMVTRDV